ncbi:hypothetical protein UA32_10595 [Photobacterium angustum]|uniref:Uncharacterized protein n=1 Tax=Photobacterium angustum TaxID=661 RepID=A0ABX5H640_PHOAN|nr:hypothetical protein UA32_10595 [Photobacterium angustum]PSX11080.1 hypothetical protein C0W27_07900 [Photobacterium angustum]
MRINPVWIPIKVGLIQVGREILLQATIDLVFNAERMIVKVIICSNLAEGTIKNSTKIRLDINISRVLLQ